MTALHIDHEKYSLDSESDTGDLQAEILTAVHGGGDFITFRTTNGHTVTVLVTTATAVRFDSEDAPSVVFAAINADDQDPYDWDYDRPWTNVA